MSLGLRCVITACRSASNSRPPVACIHFDAVITGFRDDVPNIPQGRCFRRILPPSSPPSCRTPGSRVKHCGAQRQNSSKRSSALRRSQKKADVQDALGFTQMAIVLKRLRDCCNVDLYMPHTGFHRNAEKVRKVIRKASHSTRARKQWYVLVFFRLSSLLTPTRYLRKEYSVPSPTTSLLEQLLGLTCR